MERLWPALLILAVVAVIPAIIIAHLAQEKSCAQFGKETGQQTYFKARVGCLVKQGDLWMIKR